MGAARFRDHQEDVDRRLPHLIEAHDRGSSALPSNTVLRTYFIENVDVILGDALIHHGLIYGDDHEPVDDWN